MKEIISAWWVREILNDEISKVMAVTAGLGSGKTHGGTEWFHRLVRINNESKFSAYLQPTYQKVMDTAIPTYQKVLQQFDRTEDLHYKIIKSPHPKLVYLDQRVKHEVHFLSAETPKRIVGAQYSHAMEDEAGANDVDARRALRVRLNRDPKAIRRQFLIVGAPQGVNEFADEFDSETLPGWNTDHSRDHYLDRIVEGVMVRKRRFIVWTDDNPFVTKEYIIELQDTYGHNPNLIQSYRYGRFCPLTEKAVFGAYMPQKHDVDGYEANPYNEIIMKWDFNAQPLAWVASQKFVSDFPVRRHTFVSLHEANEGATNLDDSCVEFSYKFPPERFGETPIYLYGDRTGHAQSHKVSGSDFENVKLYLNKLGFRHVVIKAQRQVAPEASSVDALNRLFINGSYLVHKRCRMLRRGLLATKWQDGVRKIEKPSGETHTHHPDAVKYWAWQERNNLNVYKRILGKN